MVPVTVLHREATVNRVDVSFEQVEGIVTSYRVSIAEVHLIY